MRTRSQWPGQSDPWQVWNMRPSPVVKAETEEFVVNERQPSPRIASLAGKVMAGHEPTEAEARSLAASVLSQRKS